MEAAGAKTGRFFCKNFKNPCKKIEFYAIIGKEASLYVQRGCCPAEWEDDSMRKTLVRCACALCAVIIGLACLGVYAPARADGYATYGNAQGDTTFFVSATGPATITLTQNGMGLAEKQYIYNSANTATEYMYAQYSVQYKGNKDYYWQQAAVWNSEVCTLNFSRADVYTVRVMPTNIRNITSTQANWRYTRWIATPAWYVSGVRNCSVYSDASYTPISYATATPRPTSTPRPYQTASAPVTLHFWDVSGFEIASPQVQYMTPGAHTVQSPLSFDGYTLVGMTARQVNVSYNGVASPNTVHLLFRKGSGSGVAGRTKVTPYRWDTRFKEGTSQKNAKWGRELPNLYDDNRYTTFKWTVWTSEWNDGIPEITAYFNGDTVGAIGIRNGDAASEDTFRDCARATQWRIRVWNRYGQYQDTVVDMNRNYTADYQVFPLNQAYTNVERVEIFMTRYTKGDRYTNGLYISDMMFFAR